MVIYRGWLAATRRARQESFFRQLLVKQFLPAGETGRLHSRKLGRMLRFSCTHVPYYREQFRALGLTGRDAQARPLEVLAALPLLDKTILRERFEDLQSNDLGNRRWFFNTSGGSTGEPVRFVQDGAYQNRMMGGKALFDNWSGYASGEPQVRLWGSERDLLTGREDVRTRVGRWLRNETPLNTFRMSDADMRHYVETINRVAPVQVLAYAESAFELACFIEREGLKIHSPRAVMTSAGTLYPHMREAIERVFGARVFNRYGSREAGDIACECEGHRGLHVNPYTHRVEIVSEDGSPCAPGRTGEIVVTLLTNEAMPLLRYRIGDMAAWAQGPCSCGRSWPLLEQVSGRVMEVFRRRDGSPVVPEYFIHFIGVTMRGELNFIKKFQVIQEGFDKLKMLVVPRVGKEEARRQLSAKKEMLDDLVVKVMGERCGLEVLLVEDIPKTPSGKYCWTKVHMNARNN